ncbi:MAG: exodeoxyribonuclease VII large subunit [Aeromicrobium sp.]|nr:exodeoxyribonuclease VII large subunit [Burkholderiales bacterium]
MEPDDLPLFSTPITPRNAAQDGDSVRFHTTETGADGRTEPISVSELNRRVKGLLEANFELRWVRGELSNVMRAASGHWYFSLKDDRAQVRCVMFRNRAQSVTFTPENGIEVDIRALPSLYEARGEFQLGVEAMRRSGVGALFEAFERLKRKLGAEGLFDEHRKRALPGMPRIVGIVTSPNAAALQDVLTTFRRRSPMTRIIIYPTTVQGADAGREIAAAIDAARTRAEVDALLICRGGGSAEDLWSFNEEAVARAIARFQQETSIPVVSGVGHETDFTICDFVADMRAPTPTAAAEMLSPDAAKLREYICQRAAHFETTIRRFLGQLQQRVDLASRGLLSPEQRIAHAREKLGQTSQRLARALQFMQTLRQQQLHQGRSRFLSSTPDVALCRERITYLGLAVERSVALHMARRQQTLAQRAQALLMLNPQQVLRRGYVMVQRNDPQHTLVTARATLQSGDPVVLQFYDGKAEANVS